MEIAMDVFMYGLDICHNNRAIAASKTRQNLPITVAAQKFTHDVSHYSRINRYDL